MKPWILLLTACLGLTAGARADELPVRIDLQVPSSVQPGKPARLVVELRGESGRPAAAAQELQVQLAGAAGLGAPPRVSVPAGVSRIEVPIRAPKAGLWQVEASSKGLFSGFGVVVCVDKAPATRTTALSLPRQPAARPEAGVARRTDALEPRARLRVPARPRREAAVDRAAPEPPPPEPPPPEPAGEIVVLSEPPDEAPVEIALEPAAAEAAPQGRVELIAQPAKLRRTREGWKSSRLEAFWFEGDVPGPSPRKLDLNLVFEKGGDSVEAAPNALSIPGGEFRSAAPALVSARNVDSAVVRALYLGGKSNPVQIDFLSPTPAQLALAGASRSFRGLTGVTSEIFVRVLDEEGQPVVADKEIPVEVAVEGPLGTRSYAAKVPAGAIQAKATLDLNRPGTYSVQASAPGLTAAEPLEVRFALDWLLIASSLLGGVLGSLTRVLYRREWPKGLSRAVPLGIAAALLVLLLSIFGVLSVLGEALPVAKALETVPATSLLGALLLGFIAGLVFDKVFGRFLGGRGAEPPAPAPKEAPA
jgi:hypothetical protein